MYRGRWNQTLGTIKLPLTVVRVTRPNTPSNKSSVAQEINCNLLCVVANETMSELDVDIHGIIGLMNPRH